MDALDNPIYASLASLHARFALTKGQARRFIPEIGPLAGFDGELAHALAALAELTAAGQTIGLFLMALAPAFPGWTLVKQGSLLQMIHGGGPLPPVNGRQIDLSAADAPEMLELATLTKPGPFASRTHELGRFVGVREDGRLAAMAGERLKLPGYTEISAVCTHPEHLGRGHAGAVMSVVARRIAERGETPFLHVLPENSRAVSLYERLGFRRRALLSFAILRKDA